MLGQRGAESLWWIALVTRHHEASALLSSVREIVATRPAGGEPPSWLVRRGWVEFLAGLSDEAVLAAERDGLAAHAAAARGAPPDLVELAQAVGRVTELPSVPGRSPRVA